LWVAFGFLFFSASAGKLPGYLLPLFPAVAALAGVALDEAKNARWLLAACGLLLAMTPVISKTFPGAFAQGLSRTPVAGWHWGFGAACLVVAGGVWWLESAGKRNGAVGLLFASAILGIALLKADALPALDQRASGRPLWKKVASDPSAACVEEIHRNWRYSLNYYSVTPLPDCGVTPRPVRIRQFAGAPPFVE
jgi:4-amino-4-deoxy-L-arabinose transferase-like glycosyltransferase